LHLQSAKSPPITPGAPYCLSAGGRGATTYNRLVRAVVRLITKTRMGKLRAFRAAIGLPPTREDFFLDFGRANSADVVFGLFSPRFCAVQPDHPKNLIVPGFPFYESRDPERNTLHKELEAFLAAGEPPIVFTLGSFAAEVSGEFYDRSLRVARALGVMMSAVRPTRYASCSPANTVRKPSASRRSLPANGASRNSPIGQTALCAIGAPRRAARIAGHHPQRSLDNRPWQNSG
jgi:UDP:flavonoid glycosyltransferase YjiC (YdhE family)